MRALIFIALFLFVSVVHASEEATIRALLSEQQAAWNRADIPGFMAGYWNSPQLRFASGGEITHGHAETLARYQNRYRDAKAMGRLQFDVIEVREQGAGHAVVFGRWTLFRDKDKPTGLFTLTLQKFSDGWKITSDHTSSAD